MTDSQTDQAPDEPPPRRDQVTLDELLLLGEGGRVESSTLDGARTRISIIGRRFTKLPQVMALDCDLTFDGCEFSGAETAAARLTLVPERATVVIKNCVFPAPPSAG